MAFDVTLPQGTLQGLLRAAGRAVTARGTHPVLQGVLLAATDASCRLCAVGYDMALGIRTDTEAIVKQAGSIVAPYRMLSALVGALPEGSMVRLVAEDPETLRIEAGEGRYSVALSHEPDDFPTLPTLDDVEPLGLPFGAIRRALSAVAYAAATEESKQVLCGVELKIMKGDLQLTAADGARGSVYKLPSIADTGKDSSFVVPAASVKEILKLGLADDDLLLVSHTQAFALFDAGDTAIITNLTAGTYPAFSQLLPKTCKTEIIGDRQAIISAVERASIVANAENGVLSFKYDMETGDVSISAANDAGSAADLVATQNGSKGNAFIVALASRFILDALRHVESELVSIGFNDIRMILVSPVGSTLHRQMVASIQVKAATPA